MFDVFKKKYLYGKFLGLEKLSLERSYFVFEHRNGRICFFERKTKFFMFLIVWKKRGVWGAKSPITNNRFCSRFLGGLSTDLSTGNPV